MEVEINEIRKNSSEFLLIIFMKTAAKAAQLINFRDKKNTQTYSVAMETV